MTYHKAFKAKTQEEALRLAEEYKQTLDPWSQPSVQGAYCQYGEWIATVYWYGLD